MAATRKLIQKLIWSGLSSKDLKGSNRAGTKNLLVQKRNMAIEMVRCKGEALAVQNLFPFLSIS